MNLFTYIKKVRCLLVVNTTLGGINTYPLFRKRNAFKVARYDNPKVRRKIGGKWVKVTVTILSAYPKYHYWIPVDGEFKLVSEYIIAEEYYENNKLVKERWLINVNHRNSWTTKTYK
ncbi:hypothetical protein KAMFAM_260 [Bacillus phage Kamfam]|nr:hypothetical protein OTK52_258 [Bacillus phage OTooleKemple52]AXQ67097.1 hypothetical protein KAMFAM_260 [Bacillus phage Kamfam]